MFVTQDLFDPDATQKALLKEFEGYRTRRRLKEGQIEVQALLEGFKNAWIVKDYATIITVAEKLPEGVLNLDDRLVLYYDLSITRSD
ncbi:hypothetical protein [Giesbergeria anulus]|uniref:Uncharacterized protein n=1 Tax=Giesbergeria anulus TaxID=180197 RepID=A0A1H9NGV0_9BURK|nr:hypothetical protein [Giesbergeria anulus]SER35118.1 hypothetical protein SAMN02982919_02213 [Giesbergeria anulus]